MPIRLAFTGTGSISKVHAASARAAGAELVAAVNHRPESMGKFAAEFNIPRQYANLRDLLKDGSVDAVVIGTPNYLHAPETISALNAGVPVMVEKPMAMNAEIGRAHV